MSTNIETGKPSNEDVFDSQGRSESDLDFDNPFIGAASERARQATGIPKVVPMTMSAEDAAIYEGYTKPKAKPNVPRILKVAGITAAAGVAAGLVGTELVDQIDGIQYSAETVAYEVQPGDSLQKIIYSAIEGGNKVDLATLEDHIKADPANVAIFEDGDVLQPGEIITIPVSVDD